MLELPESSNPEPNPLRALRRHAVVVVSSIVIFAVLGAILSANRQESYVSAASLVIENPSETTLFGTARSADTERYVANQIALLRSSALADRAKAIAESADPDTAITSGSLIRDTAVSVTPETEFVEIEFEAADPETAQLGANSIALAYQDAVQERLEGDVSRAKENLDDSIIGVTARIANLQHEIEDIRAESGDRVALGAQVSEIISDLVDLRTLLPTIEGTAAVEQLVEELRARILVGELELQEGPTALLLRQQTDALELLSSLYSQRSQIELDAGFAGNGVAVYSPAGLGQPKGISIMAALVIGGAVGGMVGAGIAYLLEARSWKFSNQSEPQLVLGVPALARVPDFDEERINTLLPARDALASNSAESFRFLTVAIDRGQEQGKRSRSVAIISANLGDGKTTVAANTALAAAQEGLNVLILDADVGEAGLTTLLAGDHSGREARLGLTDLVVSGESLEDVALVVQLPSGLRLSVLTFGRTHVDPISFFRSADTQRVLSSIRAEYDLLLIDVPPVLEVAYATPLLGIVDEVIIVVPHGSDSAKLSDARDRLELLGIRPTGYVYNKAPLRRRIPRVGSSSTVPAAPAASDSTSNHP